jgi:flagellin
MIGINSNINSLIAQQNLNSTQSALSSAITRLSSGKRINSAADDAAGQAIASRMTSQINGLNQGVSNANDGVSMTQTASSGLSQITDNLQRIRQLAVQAATGSLSPTDQSALQSEVSQRIAEVNRIASQTTYNGTNVLDGSAGVKSFQIGANVGQTISLDLSQGVSAAQLGTGVAGKGVTLGSFSNLNLDASTGGAVSGATTSKLTSVNVLADGNGGFTFTDQNNQSLSAGAVTTLFGGQAANTGSATAPSALTLTLGGALSTTAGAAQAAAAANALATVQAISGKNSSVTSAQFAADLTGVTTANYKTSSLGQLTGLSLNTDGTAYTGSGKAAISSIEVYSNGTGGFTFGTNGTDPTVGGNALGAAATTALFATTAAGANGGTVTLQGDLLTSAAFATPPGVASAASTAISINLNNVPPKVSDINISTTPGANQAIESIDNALNSINSLQANLGAAQNRFTSIASTQTAQSTNLSTAQSQITDANFAQETANLSKAQVLQQAGISVLAQANSLPQQVLKLLG